MVGLNPHGKEPWQMTQAELDRAAVDLYIERHGREAYERGEIGETLERIDQKAEEYDPVFLSRHPELKGESITVYHDPLRGEDLAVINTQRGEVVEVLSDELTGRLAKLPATDVERVMAHHNVSREEAERWLTVYPGEKLLPERGAGLTHGTTNPLARVADEEFASQIAKYVASIPVSTFVRMAPGAIKEPVLAMAREKGYEDGPRFMRYFTTPEGQAFYMERYRLELEARKPKLSEEEKGRVIREFKQVMEREPTPAEMHELYAEELKLKQKVLIK